MSHSSHNSDIREHVCNGDPCPCMPRVVDGVVVHNSYDGREVGEVIMRLVKVALDIGGTTHNWTAEQCLAVEHAEAVVALHWPDALVNR